MEDGLRILFSPKDLYKEICEREWKMADELMIREKAIMDESLNIGIVGAGIAGLYSALLLQREAKERSKNIRFKIFEVNDRVGGRIYTYKFNEDENQYFEAGAMRIPESHKIVFQLIEYLNQYVDPQRRIELIEYVMNHDNNFVFVNNNGGRRALTRQELESNLHEHLSYIFPLLNEEDRRSPSELLHDAIGDYVHQLQIEHSTENLDRLVRRFDDYSIYSYLSNIEHWYESKINYVETMLSQTHQFHHGFIDSILEFAEFGQIRSNECRLCEQFPEIRWKTIKNGMSRLPEACGEVIGYDYILRNTKIHKISTTEDNKIKLHYSKNSEEQFEIFDKVILAVPPSVIRMMDRPFWTAKKEQCIRELHFQPLYKIGLKFRSRFWENSEMSRNNPSFGGQSTTDLPSRWIVYPSNGIQDDGSGVLLCYNWMSDSLKMLPLSQREREEIALRDLSKIYQDDVIRENFMESHSICWASEWPLGAAQFLPGQFKKYGGDMNAPEDNIYFAGEHLSVHHTWIMGAICSALDTCGMILDRSLEPLG